MKIAAEQASEGCNGRHWATNIMAEDRCLIVMDDMLPTSGRKAWLQNPQWRHPQSGTQS